MKRNAQPKRVPTSREVCSKIDKMFYENSILLDELYQRWQNEREYEEWKDYAKRMSLMLPKDFTFKRATKRPFGFEFEAQGAPEGALYAMTATAHGVAWVRLN